MDKVLLVFVDVLRRFVLYKETNPQKNDINVGS